MDPATHSRLLQFHSQAEQETYTRAVTDDPARKQLLDAWLATPGGRKFPGQGHLSAITAGGAGPATHVVGLGYASVAEQEAYVDSLVGNPDYAAMQAAMAKASTRVGTYLSQDVKSWGPATRKSFTE